MTVGKLCFGQYERAMRADRACRSCKESVQCIPGQEELTMAGSYAKAFDDIFGGVFNKAKDGGIVPLSSSDRVVISTQMPPKSAPPLPGRMPGPTEQPRRSKYHREIKPGVFVDVYDVLAAWKVENPALQHLIKKALQPGASGHKSRNEDLSEIVASAIRAREIG